MGMQPVLSVTAVPIKKIKAVTRQCYGDKSIGMNRSLRSLAHSLTKSWIRTRVIKSKVYIPELIYNIVIEKGR